MKIRKNRIADLDRVIQPVALILLVRVFRCVCENRRAKGPAVEAVFDDESFHFAAGYCFQYMPGMDVHETVYEFVCFRTGVEHSETRERALFFARMTDLFLQSGLEACVYRTCRHDIRHNGILRKGFFHRTAGVVTEREHSVATAVVDHGAVGSDLRFF